MMSSLNVEPEKFGQAPQHTDPQFILTCVASAGQQVAVIESVWKGNSAFSNASWMKLNRKAIPLMKARVENIKHGAAWVMDHERVTARAVCAFRQQSVIDAGAAIACGWWHDKILSVVNG
jgi:hypothetical protein